MVDPKIHISEEILAIARCVVKGEASLVRVNALAGTGKTTLLSILETYHYNYWQNTARKPGVVFLAYSKLLVDEARILFDSNRVSCLSVFDLAHAYYDGRKTVDFSKHYSWKLFAHYFHVDYSLASQINTLLYQWLTSGCDENALSSYDFVESYDALVYDYVQTFITDTRCGEEGTFMTQEFVLKEFQLALLKQPSISPLDLLLVDEGQDLSDAALSILLHYPSKIKVIVGDTNQKIYDFVSTKNALIQEMAHYAVIDFTLSVSYRHEKLIAQKAEWILQTFKGQSVDFEVYEDIHRSTPPARTSCKGILCATPLGLLEALMYAQKEKLDTLDLTSFDLEDLFALPLEIFTCKALSRTCKTPPSLSLPLIEQFNLFIKEGIYSTFFDFLMHKPMESFKGNLNTAMMSVKTYTYEILQALYFYAKMASSSSASSESVVICTIHQSKGFEFDTVVVMEDIPDLAQHVASYFIRTQNTAKRGPKYDFLHEFGAYILKYETIFNDRDVSQWTYAINLYYTAITRARKHYMDRSPNQHYLTQDDLNRAVFKCIESAKRKQKKEA